MEFIFSGNDHIAPFLCLDIGQCSWKVLSEIFLDKMNKDKKAKNQFDKLFFTWATFSIPDNSDIDQQGKNQLTGL